jgi:hypothetical protein
MWVLVLLGLIVAAIVFVLSLFFWPSLFIIFRYVGFLPIVLASIVIKPVTAALKQTHIPSSRKFRNIYAFIAMIGMVAGGAIWIFILIIQSISDSTLWVAVISIGLALLALAISYIVERNGYYYKQFPEAMKTLKKVRRIYEEDNITIEYKRDISSYLCSLYRDLMGSQITGICICDAQGRLVTDSRVIEQVGKAVYLVGQYQEKFNVKKALEEELKKIDDRIAQTDEFLQDFAELERIVYPDEELYAIWHEINTHAETIVKHGLSFERLLYETRLNWMEEFSPERYITEQDIQDFETVLSSVYDEYKPINETMTSRVAEMCEQFKEKLESENYDTEVDLAAYNRQRNHYYTRVVNLVIAVIKQSSSTRALPNISFNDAERELLREKMEWASEKIRY